MILINEWLPNPKGSDTTGEWVELFNNGNTAQDISGWKLTAGAKGKYIFPKTVIQGDEYLIVHRKTSKLVLRNSDEAIFLFDARGNMEDSSAYLGTAPEGKSFSRVSLENSDRNFVFAEPTPGGENKISGIVNLIDNAYPPHVPLNSVIGLSGMVVLACAAALVVTSLVFYVVKTNAYLKDIFFGKY